MTNFIYIKRVKNIIFHIFTLQLQTAKVMLKKKWITLLVFLQSLHFLVLLIMHAISHWDDFAQGKCFNMETRFSGCWRSWTLSGFAGFFQTIVVELWSALECGREDVRVVHPKSTPMDPIDRSCLKVLTPLSFILQLIFRNVLLFTVI